MIDGVCAGKVKNFFIELIQVGSCIFALGSTERLSHVVELDTELTVCNEIEEFGVKYILAESSIGDLSLGTLLWILLFVFVTDVFDTGIPLLFSWGTNLFNSNPIFEFLRAHVQKVFVGDPRLLWLSQKVFISFKEWVFVLNNLSCIELDAWYFKF